MLKACEDDGEDKGEENEDENEDVLSNDGTLPWTMFESVLEVKEPFALKKPTFHCDQCDYVAKRRFILKSHKMHFLFCFG